MIAAPPPPPALVEQARQDPRLSWVYESNGAPRFRRFAQVTRLVEVCWEDGAGLRGWQPTPSGCWRPDLRTPAGQQWQVIIDRITYPNDFAPLTAQQ